MRRLSPAFGVAALGAPLAYLLACAGLLASACVWAGGAAPTLVIGHVSGPAGSTRSVPFSFDSGSAVLGGIQLEMSIPTDLTVSAASASGPGGGTAVVCSTPTTSLLICLIFNDTAPLPAQFEMRLSFMAAGAATATTVPLELDQLEYLSTSSNPVPAGPTTPGSFEILPSGPAIFSSLPVPGTLIDFGNVVHGMSAARTVQVSNVALPDFPDLNISNCSVSGSVAWSIVQPGQFPVQLPAGSSLDLVVAFSANAGQPLEILGGLGCSVNDGNSTSEVSWPLRAASVPDALLADSFE